LRNQAFTLIVYDGEGNVLQKKPCEIHEITLDRKEKKKYEIPGHLFSVTATVKPDNPFFWIPRSSRGMTLLLLIL